MPAPPVVLSIAGYDPSSGAGITADIKTAAALGCYAVTCITAMTVQSTQGVFAVEPVAREIVRETLTRLCQDFEIAAVRIGMLGTRQIVTEVITFLEQQRLPNVVIDPVIRSTSGMPLLDPVGLYTLRQSLLPTATLITPNIEEAAELALNKQLPHQTSWETARPTVRELADALHDLGARGVLITGGHLQDPVDYLSVELPFRGVWRSPLDAPSEPSPRSRVTREFSGERIESGSTHGTGCALATAIACQLAKGQPITDAVGEAKEFVRDAIRHAYPLGKGIGPLNHLFRLEE
jgi:hydroxymethylpyrimidine/phosphomethylpyrimidine kinase